MQHVYGTPCRTPCATPCATRGKRYALQLRERGLDGVELGLEGVALLGDELQLELGVRELRDELVVGEGPRVEVRGHARELRLLEEAVRAGTVSQDRWELI